jgi:hypothetical protein
MTASVEDSPFALRTVLALVVGGAALFVALLWVMGAGWGGGSANDGGAHGASRGLTGFAAMADFLAARDFDVQRAQDRSALRAPGLLVLTPPAEADGRELDRTVTERRTIGPTLVIAPKWAAFPAGSGTPHKPGWVRIAGTALPGWKGFLDEIAIGIAPLPSGEWQGAGLKGALPAPGMVLSGQGRDLVPLVTDASGTQVLAGYLADRGYYPALAALAGSGTGGRADDDERLYPVILVFEPDLLDNFGMKDSASALLAEKLVRAAGENGRGVTFDLTFNGHVRTSNLLTLAFTPPFLAATLCLLSAALAAGWRGFLRFGPARRPQGPAIAFGKQALVANSAGMIVRTGRLRLLARPYAAAVRERLVRALALPRGVATETTDAAIDRALARRAPDGVPFSVLAARLEAARGRGDLVAAASELHALERTLTR